MKFCLNCVLDRFVDVCRLVDACYLYVHSVSEGFWEELSRRRVINQESKKG
jgi:hypothetical protein